MNHPERILCVSRADLPTEWLAAETSLPISLETFFSRMARIPFSFMTRPEVEHNPAFKQLIPYLLVQTPDRQLTACYRRNGSEQRLHALWSTGIGGHVSETDKAAPHATLRQIVASGLRREMIEEFHTLPGGPAPVFQGIINEEQTEVGTVHLGLVYRLAIADPAAVIAGEELCDFRWLEASTLRALPLERWSRLALALIGL